MGNNMGHARRLPGPTVRSFSGIDRQIERNNSDRQADRQTEGQGNKDNWVRGPAAVSGLQIQLSPGDLGCERGWQGPQFL